MSDPDPGLCLRRRAFAWSALVAAVLCGASCSASPERCKVQCGTAGDCPDDTVCGADLFCHSRDEPAEMCTAAAGDAAPTGDAAGQADAGLLAIDQPCAEADSCEADLICADFGVGGAHCKRTCTGRDDCAGRRSRCSRTDTATSSMVCSSNCDPLGTGDCADDEKCVLSRAPDGLLDANCIAHGGLEYQDLCETSADCGPALLCIGTAPDKFCEHLCVVGSADCGLDQTCPAVTGDNTLAGVAYSYCQ